jgi:thiamine biosynthesis lipoprotein
MVFSTGSGVLYGREARKAMNKLTPLAGALLLLAGSGLPGGERRGEPKRFEFSERHMGTVFRIVLYAADEADARKAAKQAFARTAELDGIMSDYKPASELMRLCKKAGGEPVPVSEDLFKILQRAEDIWRRSDGAFDVTVAPVVRLWRRARRTGEMPDPEELRRALAKVGFRNVRLNRMNRTVQLLLMGMLLDLGGIAKGYAAEEMLALLRRLGIMRALVAAGGDIVVGDPPPGAKGWKIGVAPLEDPNAKPSRYLLLKNAGVSTSGSSEQYVVIGGKRYSHIVDPKTGIGVTTQSSVTVVKPGGTADGLASPVCVLGPERGLKMIESIEGAAALIVVADGKGQKTYVSKRFPQYELKSP